MITVLYIICSATEHMNGATQSSFDLIESLRGRVKFIVLFRYKGMAYDYFVNHGIECYTFPYLLVYGHRLKWFHYVLFPWHIWYIKNLRKVWKAKRFINRELQGKQIDIIHTGASSTTFGYHLSKLLKVKHVWHVRDYLEMGVHIPGDLFVSFSHLKKLINKSDARIAISNPCRMRWHMKDDNTWTILDAVRSEKDICYERNKEPYILFCTYYISEVGKGASKVVNAFGKSGLFKPSHDNNQTIRLKMVGKCDDEYKKELVNLAENYGCAEFIDFIPLQDDVKPYFTHAMAYVNASVNEGMGRTTAEAMFYGCPVIGHASGGTLDLIKDSETGYLFNTVEECAELIKKVCTTNQEEVIIRAQEFARQNLSIENYGEKILGIYNTVSNTM